MQSNLDILRSLRLTTAIALLVLTCGAPTRAWCANLWASFLENSIETYTPGQLKTSGSPTPTELTTFDDETGLAFDKSHNLWAVINDDEVVRFTAAQLKKLKEDPSPTPGVIITSTSTFVDLNGCNFDRHGNLWTVDGETHTLEELSKAQLAAGSGDVTPAIVITSSDLGSPGFLTFDEAGNAWLDNQDLNTIVEFSASQLTSSGSKSASVVLSDDGSGTSISDPGEIAFDDKGNLWVPNFNSNNVVEYAKSQLTSSGDPAPTVKLSSAVFNGPFGAVFDSKGDLVTMNFTDGTIAKFAAKQIKASGSPVPDVTVTGSATANYQIIFGPAS